MNILVLLDEILVYIFRYASIISIGNIYNISLVCKKFSILTNYSVVDINGHKHGSLTDNAVSKLINITNLNLRYNNIITDNAVSKLINITSLNLRYNKTITDNAVSRLINLTNLF